jgi:hypothetical protein
MRTRSRRRSGWSAAGALAFVLGLPTLADAQTTELFPFARLNRKRVPCEMEDPVYKMYRQQYYGYHPTCWRRFPTGWGCPSPEAPDATKSFKDLPRDPITPPDDGGNDRGPGPNREDPGPGRRGGNAPGLDPNSLPLPGGDRSPFEMDTKPDAAPNGARPPASRPAPSATPAPAPAPNNDGGAGLPPLLDSPAAGPSASNLPAPGPVEPILAVSDPTVAASGAMAPDATPPPAQAPRRTSIISNLFGGRTLFRR